MPLDNGSIGVFEEMSAKSHPAVLDLSRNREIGYNSGFTKIVQVRNPLTGTYIEESYMYGDGLDREVQIEVNENGTQMELESEFQGMGHLGVFKKAEPNATIQDEPLFEVREDYTGSFTILERVDEYGSSVTSEKSASGQGFVVVDKRIDESQRSYESGTGTYDSEEEIETHTGYIAKDVSLSHQPLDHAITGRFSLNPSLKWKEGVWSKIPDTSFIGEEYSDLDRLDKETVAKGLGEMDTEAEFSGRASYRTVLRDEVDMDEEYVGDYAIQRKIQYQGVPRYDLPHLVVTKEGDLVDHSDRLIARYTITLENDGSRTLEPVYVNDTFPPGAVFVNASVRPATLAGGYAVWTLTHLSVGDVSEIRLNLDVTEAGLQGGDLVNRVEACGEYDGESICARNFSAIEIDWLTCCLDETVTVSKTGELDPNEPNVVWYTLTIRNGADSTRVATVTDLLPEGMRLLDSSPEFASYEGGAITWNLIEIEPFETETIRYRVEALWSGTFVNRARVDARSIDGPAVRPVYADAVVNVGDFEGEREAPGWQPPDWRFSQISGENGELAL